MNKLIRSGSIVILGMAACWPYQAQADTVSPSDTEIVVNDLFVSKKADCSNPIQVMHNPSATAVNMISSPKLGTGTVPKGTYPCVIVGINSEMTTTPGASTTASVPPECVKGTPVNQQICRTGGSTVNPATGATINCQTGTATEVYGYFSTSGTQGNNGGNNSSGLSPGTALPLNSALVVTSNHTLTFVVDFDNTMSDDGLGGTCQTHAPTMLAR